MPRLERKLKVLKASAGHVTSINSDRQHDNLSSAIRLFVLNYYQSALSDEARRVAPSMVRGFET